MRRGQATLSTVLAALLIPLVASAVSERPSQLPAFMIDPMTGPGMDFDPVTMLPWPHRVVPPWIPLSGFLWLGGILLVYGLVLELARWRHGTQRGDPNTIGRGTTFTNHLLVGLGIGACSFLCSWITSPPDVVSLVLGWVMWSVIGIAAFVLNASLLYAFRRLSRSKTPGS